HRYGDRDPDRDVHSNTQPSADRYADNAVVDGYGGTDRHGHADPINYVHEYGHPVAAPGRAGRRYELRWLSYPLVVQRRNLSQRRRHLQRLLRRFLPQHDGERLWRLRGTVQAARHR